MRRYKTVSERLASEFKAELQAAIAMAGANPNRFHAVKPGFHRANLTRFPYHFIYRETPEGIRQTANPRSSPLIPQMADDAIPISAD